MSFRLLNRARMTLIGTPGTGTLTLNAGAAGFQSLSSAGMSDGDTTSYVIEDGSPIGTAWEIGVGTYHSNGTFSRDLVTQSSAGGTTKISVTSTAVLSATVRSEDLAAGGSGGGGAGSAPVVIQYKLVGSSGQVIFDYTPTPGNVIIAIGNSPDNNGAQGFNFSTADNQYQQHSTTAFRVGYGFQLVTLSNYALLRRPIIGNPGTTVFNGLALEVSGADVASFAAMNGVFTSSSSTTQAANAANSLGIIFFGGDGGANPSITAPSSFQINDFNSGVSSIQAGWNTLSGSGNAGITGSVASGSNGVLALNIPGV